MNLSEYDAAGLRKGYASGDLTPVQVINALADRIKSCEPALNAVSELLFDDALEAASVCESELKRGSDCMKDKPLFGVPVLVKEQHPIAGKVLSHALPDPVSVASQDHLIVERLRAAGALVIARSTNPEMCAATFTASKACGVTRNPWDLSASPGGSSGGSAAGLAAGYAPLATGADMGGSTRIPAALSGVIGYKAPYGVVPGIQPSGSDWFRSDSAMGRSVEDVRIMHNVIAGQHRDDPVSLPKNPVQPVSDFKNLAGLRVGVSYSLGNYEVSDSQLVSVDNVAGLLESYGASVVRVNPQITVDGVLCAAMAHYGHLLAPTMKRRLAGVNGAVSGYVEEFIDYALGYAGRVTFAESVEREASIRAELLAMFDRVDCVICPMVVRDWYPAQGPGQTVDSDNRHYWKDYLALPFNIANRHPVLVVPSGLARNGMPTSAQIVGKPYDQDVVFRVGSAIEAGLGWKHVYAGCDPREFGASCDV